MSIDNNGQVWIFDVFFKRDASLTIPETPGNLRKPPETLPESARKPPCVQPNWWIRARKSRPKQNAETGRPRGRGSALFEERHAPKRYVLYRPLHCGTIDLPMRCILCFFWGQNIFSHWVSLLVIRKAVSWKRHLFYFPGLGHCPGSENKSGTDFNTNARKRVQHTSCVCLSPLIIVLCVSLFSPTWELSCAGE